MVRLQCINYVTILGKRKGNVLFDENRMLHKFHLDFKEKKTLVRIYAHTC